MASLFEIGKTGVQAYRQALSVTGQNIANINTDGYNKRSADVNEIASVSGGPTNVSDSTGLGVRVASVRRSFDAYLADKARSSQSDFEMLNDFVSKLSDLENMLLPSGSDLGVFIGRFFDSLQDVASNPDNISARTVSLEAGKALVSSFNNYDQQLKNFKSNAIRQFDVKTTEANLYINQLVEVNKLIATSGSKDASNDVLDARDKLLKDLSKIFNFTVDYAETGEAIVRLGDSGSGSQIINRTQGSQISSSSDSKNISLVVNNKGIKTKGIFSSGILSGISQFYSLVDSVSTEISKLADQMTREVNKIQTSGIDLNGNIGQSMFSVNSMVPITNVNNKSNISLNLIVGNASEIAQERIIVNYSKMNNNWEIRNSSGLSYAYGNRIDFEGFQVEITGDAEDGDGFIISPTLSKAGAMKFNLSAPEQFAAASKNLISKSSTNVGNVDLKVIGSVDQRNNDFPPKIDQIFTSSNNPLVATTFLKDGSVTSIPSTTKSVNLNSLGNQSSGTFTISDADIKGFSSFNITLENGNEINISASSSDPGDGIKSVKEFADLLNSGLMLDGKSQHDFKNYGLFASGSNGYLTITSSLSDINSSSILSKGNSYTPSISNVTSNLKLASNMQVFTRDGRHISGTSLNTSEIASLIKTENGFLDTAEYRNDYLNSNYRGINSIRQTAEGDYIQRFGSNVSYNEQATDMDGLLTSKTLTSGTITLDGTKIYSKELNSVVSITSEKDESSQTFTVTGYDLDGLYQTETIPGGNISTVKGLKIFSEVSSISINNNSSGKVTIGIESIGYSLKVTNEDNVEKTINVPVGSSAYYLSNKLKTELAGTGVNATANTTVMLGPIEDGTSGSITFDLKGKNTDKVSINASVASSDLTPLAKRINEYSSQTGLIANVTNDLKKIFISSKDGYDINLKNITAPSDFHLETYGGDLTRLNNFDNIKNSKLLIDVSDSKKVSANIKGEIRFISSEKFTTQINSGASISSVKNSLINGYINTSTSSTGEVILITPEVFDDLDNSLSSPNGKKATVGLSKYGLDINQKNYSLFIDDEDSLYTSNNPGGTTITLNGELRNSNDLNAIVAIYCSANEASNVFTVTGTDSTGATITEDIDGVASSNTAYGSTKFKTITSISSSVAPSGNIKIGTIGQNNINDDDSLIQLRTFSTGSPITMDGVLSTSSYLGAQIQITSTQNNTGTDFKIDGIGLNNEVISETISGSNGGVVSTAKIFKTITSISALGNNDGKIKVGTKAADGNWDTTIDANALNIDTEKEISTAILTSLRKETPTSQLKGVVLNQLPIDGQKVDLEFEGQIYQLEMMSGEIIVNGPEDDRIKARFNGTSESITNLVALSQTGIASNALNINGLDFVGSTSDGLVDNETLTNAGNFNIDGSLSSIASSNLKSTVKISSTNDNSSVTFTITGTDIDGNAQTETITGVNNNTVNGTKFFKTISQISSDAAASGINVGTTSGFGTTSGTRVSITSTANESENSFTIVGTDTDGLSKTETIFGPSAGKTVSSLGLFKTITSITPTSNTSGNVEIGTSPGYELIATAEGTIEGAQFKLVSNTNNILSSEIFGLKEGKNTLFGNYVVQPTSTDQAISIEITENEAVSNFSIKFDGSTPTFFKSNGSTASGSPPSNISMSWSESSGVTDEDSLFNAGMSAGVAIITDGAQSTTDSEGLLTSKSATSGNLVLDGVFKNSKELNGKITVFCNGDETSNSFTISGYDTTGKYRTDTITGVSSGTATGSISFSEVLSVAVANDTASTIKVGIQATTVKMNAQAITITPASADTGHKYTVTGLDQFGNAQTEVLTSQGAGVRVIGEKVFSQISSIIPSSTSGTTVKVGTQRVGRLSFTYNIDKLNFKIDSSPTANKVYGIKTQNIRGIVDNNGLKISSFSGEPVKIYIPENAIQNSVAEKISLSNLPDEELITILMGSGARKISAEYDLFPDNNINNENIIQDLTIKVDSLNNNKVEILDKKSGHSIASRILDSNRVFDFGNNKFQFSDTTIIDNVFEFSSNKDGKGDNSNILNILSLQTEDKSGGNKGNFQEVFNNTVAKIGSNVQANKLSLNSATSTLDAAEASQSQFAGVNLDEEAAHLLEFQQAYQASARILQTARELFQSLIEVV